MPHALRRPAARLDAGDAARARSRGALDQRTGPPVRQLAAPGILDQHQGAMAGVLMGINQIFSVADYTKALQISFENNAQGKNGYGVMLSNRAYKAPVAAQNLTYKANFHCSNPGCRRTWTVHFASEVERHNATVGVGFMFKETTVIRCAHAQCGHELVYDPGLAQDQKHKTEYKK